MQRGVEGELFNRNRVSDLQDEKVPEVQFTTMLIHLTLLNTKKWTRWLHFGYEISTQ